VDPDANPSGIKECPGKAVARRSKDMPAPIARPAQRRLVLYKVDPMQNAEAVGSRSGVPAWLIAASIGLSLVAGTAIVVRWAGGSDSRFRRGLTGEGVVSADDSELAVDPVIIDDTPTDSTTPPKAKAILASLTTSESEAKPRPTEAPESARAALLQRAKSEMAACKERYEKIHDYTCVFHKRERIDGRLVTPHIMAMKTRTSPHSLYFKFVQPNRGREAIWDPNKNKGKVVAHDVGFGKLLAGTMILDPNGSMAMEENRHPITHAGIGHMIETVIERWNVELDPTESVVEIHPHAKVANRECTLIETTHPSRRAFFLFHRVKVYIDHEHGVPIRFEAYDWPKTAGEEAPLVEEYTYSDLKIDVGLSDIDFDPSNARYSYGRF
jgi:hypothetical protein